MLLLKKNHKITFKMQKSLHCIFLLPKTMRSFGSREKFLFLSGLFQLHWTQGNVTLIWLHDTVPSYTENKIFFVSDQLMFSIKQSHKTF